MRSLLVLALLTALGCSETAIKAADSFTDTRADRIGETQQQPDTTPNSPEDLAHDAEPDTRVVKPVTERGEYAVGYTTMQVSYLPLQAAEQRQMSVAVWYPTLASSGEPGYEN